MGDMKTPDFDDLLAAFDIPDMVDPKTAIESGHEDNESQLKLTNSVDTNQHEAQSTPGQDVGISVIVKNTRNKENKGHSQSQTKSAANQNGHHNGYYKKNGWMAPKSDGPIAPINTSPIVNQFSPISSVEEFDEDDKIDVEDPADKHSNQSSQSLGEHKYLSSSVSIDIHTESRTRCDPKLDQNNNSCVGTDFKDSIKESTHEVEIKEAVSEHERLKLMHKPDKLLGPVCLSSSSGKKEPSEKLSSCIAAIAALSAKKAENADPRIADSSDLQKESQKKDANDSPETPKKKNNNDSAQAVAKKTLTKQPNSPSSVTSEGSSKASPVSSTDSIPVIPKVRIKTIKTLSGHIKRTVTRVPSEIEGIQKAGISKSQTFIGTTSAIFTSPRHSLPTTVVANAGSFANEVTKQMTIKPVATAFLPVSAVKTAGSQVINLKLSNNTTVKATVIPASSVPSASSAILKAANTIQQQAVMVPASSLGSAKLVPKTVHLGNLNLLSQTITSSACDLQQVLSSSKKHQSEQQLKPIFCGQSSKKVCKVQVFGSSQNSVVDAFNKVLSSINPVPVYVPDLSPPSAACITLPSCGYKCLECGDSFALEKSLTQHYERRSVKIEVTCNHCARGLVFYNKCSLLSHARSHKDKGVVMQCSHLILKPIPTDQMITTASPTSIPSMNAISHSQSAMDGSQTVAISVPCNAAMPLEDDTSELSRQSLKCLECNDMFQDDSSLAMHYQQASESNGQKTCTVCQMLLPNQCSFLSHQRIHQHTPPYICPECGASCRSVHFQSHLTKICLHYTRRSGYRCVHCSVILTDAATLKSHIQSTHCEIFYKCPLCPMAFKSAPGTHSHAYTQHPGVKAGEPKLIHKCAMCDTVFTLQSLLYTHLEQHVNTYKVPVFKCPDCSMYYAQKQLMLDHIKATHGTLKTTEGPPNFGINLPLSTKSTNSNSPSSSTFNNSKEQSGNENCPDIPEKKSPLSLKRPNSNIPMELKSAPNTGYTCGECNTVFASRETYVGHMRREHGRILKKHPCRQCEKSFSSSHSLCRHNRLKHKGQRKVYTCPHCPALSQPFTKRVLLDQHIQLMHGDQEGKIISTNNLETGSNKKMTPSPKRKSEENEVSPGVNCRGADSQPLKKLKVNILKVHKCAVCGLTTENITAFHEHIPQHKSDGSSYQCKECALCYTSPRSLSRHLFIVHRLKEPQGLGRYQRQGKGDDESQRENQLNSADENDGSPNTNCKVCGKEFETEGNLNTHMRTHGMAFIKAKAKRLSATQK